MSSVENAKQKALSLVGQGYIYGAKGQICSRAFREQQAEQYPEWYDNIMNLGAKWDGKPVWDCAQFTRAVAKSAGISLVSGATSQWNKTDWDQKGTIDTLPADEFVFLYRRQNGSSTTMAHTGVSMGDGTCIHARGTAYGVVTQPIAQYAWTHWARPKWPDENQNSSEKVDDVEVLYQATVCAQNGNTVNMRKEPGGSILIQVPIGATIDVLSESAGWHKIQYNNKIGYMQSAFVKKKTDFEEKVISKLDEILTILQK